MALTLAIPTTTLATSPGKPHTLYHITLALPLRTLTVSRRYSDFLALHSQLISITGVAPPLPPPPKAYFTRTISNPTLTENRRLALESYMHAILISVDPRWRDSPPWRTFLNLPAHSGHNSAASSTTNLAWGGGIGGNNGPITDPTQWLDSHRHAKTLLHDARMQLAKRDQAVSTADQHEASAGAKRSLTKASSVLAALDAGLKTSWNKEAASPELLDGEIRRRKDLLSAARKERDGLESLANSLAAKRNSAPLRAVVASSPGDRTALFAAKPRGRVLGAPLPETERTRELDNVGVLQLNDEFMREQDKLVTGLLGNVTRMKEIGAAIGEEIEVQNRMLGALDADVDKYVYVVHPEIEGIG